MNLLADVQDRYNVGSERIYVTGLSMGGHATYDFITHRPDYFAAAVPMSGYGSTNDAPRFKDVPMWIFHGEHDSIVPVRYSREMYEALLAVGGFPRYTEIP